MTDTTNTNPENYYLIFKDKNQNVVRVVKHTLAEVYEVITDFKFPEGSYMIIKGEKII